MAHSAFERGVTLPAVLGRQEFEIVDCADMQDRGEPALLLIFIGGTGGDCLDCHTVCLADF